MGKAEVAKGLPEDYRSCWDESEGYRVEGLFDALVKGARGNWPCDAFDDNDAGDVPKAMISCCFLAFAQSFEI